jgi:hypothetical protein
VVTANTFVYLPQYVIAIFLRDALHENAKPGTAPVELAVN